MSNLWAPYDELLSRVPEDPVRACLVGRSWTLVETDHAMGMAMTTGGHGVRSQLSLPLAGRPLRDLAEQVRSWNLAESSIGLAALNAYYNDPARLRGWLGDDLASTSGATVFNAMEDELAGKKVAVIGHFPDLERLRERCALTVFERQPQKDDVPDYAEDYLLPLQDYVFITGVTLTNKTLPHLLQMCGDAYVVLVGPSVPLTPLWFGLGVDMLAGTVIIEGRGVWQVTQEGGCREIWSQGAATVEVRAERLAPAASAG